MKWVDVAGPPGVGKSTLCDEMWPPRQIPWDQKPYPDEWAEFLKVVDWLFKRIAGHPSFSTCESMVHRLFKKMSTVSRIESDEVYIQTGFAQRALGFGWRLKNPEDLVPYYETMPVSCGVVFLHAPVDVVIKRNRERMKNCADRSHMIPLMERPREIGIRELTKRGVLVEALSTENAVEDNVKELVSIAHRAI